MLEEGADEVTVVGTDGVFSMDGDIAPLPDLLRLANEYDAMVYIDDAHGTGVLGETGAGTSEMFNVKSERLISMATLSKAYGAIGGFIATEKYIADILRLTCSAYGYTSTLPPDQALAVAEAMAIVQEEPERRRRLWENQRYFVARMEGLGLKLASKQSCIVPVLFGDEARCEKCARLLEENGFHVDSIVFPAVKIGTARLRFNMNANHTRDQIDRLLDIIARQIKNKWR
jgi:7-keto-8-aminopelargonate synthetase-like enzyme